MDMGGMDDKDGGEISTVSMVKNLNAIQEMLLKTAVASLALWRSFCLGRARRVSGFLWQNRSRLLAALRIQSA
jgi:hypothetical protein